MPDILSRKINRTDHNKVEFPTMREKIDERNRRHLLLSEPDENVANKLSCMGMKMSQVAWECKGNSSGTVPQGNQQR